MRAEGRGNPATVSPGSDGPKPHSGLGPFPSALPLSAEEQLLLECALPWERRDDARISRLAGKGIDWVALVEGAVRSKLAPLVYARLNDARLLEDAPRPQRLRLAAAHASAEAATCRLLPERDRVIALLRDAGLSALPLKGCALTDTLYKDPSLRPMGDIDLLLRAEEIDRAASLLRGLGYETDGIDPRGETFFFHREASLFIDAHTDLDPSGRFRIRSEDLWAESGPSSIGHGQSLAVRHHFAHALLHAARHRLAGLGPLVDATWMADRWPKAVGWETLPELAARWRCRHALAFALEAAGLLFGLDVPVETRRRLAPRRWRRWALARIWPGDAPLLPIESRSSVVRYLYSGLTTEWPGGFLGATRRYRRIRRVVG
jgi:hypothetical protein